MQMSDIRETDVFPFKGPFKGKGQNRKALRQLQQELDAIENKMMAVVMDFNNVFTTPRLVNLRILRRSGYPLLWWRKAESSGSYIRLFHSDEGDSIINQFLPAAKSKIIEFDKSRLLLNFRATVVGNTIESYKRYDDGLDVLHQHVV